MTNGGHPDITGIPHDAKPVVLTLRKRYSIARPTAAAAESQSPPTRRPDVTDMPHDEPRRAPSLHEASRNPWEEDSGPSDQPRAGTSSQHHRHLSHRLSFDHASGVIMLPDDEDWMEESDSDEDYGAARNNLNRSVETIQTDLQQAWSGEASGSSQSPSKRYLTYYHHPERRKTRP